METKELALYREVSSMTGEVLYSYNIQDDVMTMYKGDSAQKGATTTINNYVEMLKLQNFSDDYRENMHKYIKALSTGEPSFFNLEIKTKIEGYQDVSYLTVGKTVYDDNNAPVSVIGKLYPIEGADNGSVGKIDRNTGILKAGEFRKQLADKYREHLGRIGGFMLLSLTEVYAPTDESFDADMCQLYVNIAQCLSRLFSYNAIIGRVKKDEFCVVYFGRDISGEFLPNVEELKQELDGLVNANLTKAGVRICGGVTCETFEDNGTYLALNNAGKAMGFAKYTGSNAVWMYTEDLGEAYHIYHSEDKRLHTAQMKLEHKLIQNTFKVLAETEDVKKTIMEMFNVVGTAFNLDRITMYECNSMKSSDINIYTWEREEQCQCYANRPMAVNCELIKWINKKVKMAVVPDALKVDANDPLYGALTDRIKAFVLTGFQVGTVAGCISFECHEGKHRWTSEELNIFELIKRTISTCLITVRLYYELLNAKEDGIKYDTLTGLYKYNVFLEEANEYIATHPDEKLAVVSLTLDGFVRVNQFYGYDVGDEVLKGYSGVLMNDKERFIMGCRLNANNLVGLMRLFDSRGSMISEATADVMFSEFIRDMGAKYPAAQMNIRAGMCRIDGNGMGISDYIESADRIKSR